MEKLDRLGWAVEGTYRIGSSTIGVRTTSERFGEWIAETLAPYRRVRWTDPAYAVVVGERESRRGSRGVNTLYRGTMPIVRTTHLPSVALGLLHELESLTYARRRDALYLQAGLVAAGDRMALVPWSIVPGLSGLGGRLRRAGLRLSGALTVAVDPATGWLLPAEPALADRAEALARLGDLAGDGAADARLFVTRPTRVDVVATLDSFGMNGPVRESPAATLYSLGSWVLNMEAVGGAGLAGLARLQAGALVGPLDPSGSQGMMRSLVDLLQAEAE